MGAGATRTNVTYGLRRLAWTRYRLRRFLRFSERAARSAGITPQQHQLLLGVLGYTGRGWATISELAEFLQERHNAVVGLVGRAARRGLVSKTPGERDRRYVCVKATSRGAKVLRKLTELHRQEWGRIRAQFFSASRARPRTVREKQGA